jgi:hypothetical protein
MGERKSCRLAAAFSYFESDTRPQDAGKFYVQEQYELKCKASLA